MMTEDYADEIDDTLDDIERVVEDPSELYEHFRVVVDKGQSQVRIDKYLFERLVNSSRNRIQKAPFRAFRACPCLSVLYGVRPDICHCSLPLSC